MKPIYIVSHCFPPLNNVASGRPYSWVLHFCELGYEVRVITTKKSPWIGPLNYCPELPSRCRVIETDWTFNHKESSNKIILKISRMIMGFRLFKEVKKNFKPEGGLVISTFEPGFNHIAAYLMKKWDPSLKWLADYRDGWTTNHLDKDRKVIRNRFERIIEKKLLSRIDALTSVSKGFLKDLIPLCNKEVPSEVIYNGFFAPAFLAQPFLNNNEKIKITYLGTRYKYQDPIPLFNALEKLNAQIENLAQKLEINFLGNHDDLKSIISEKKLNSIVHFKGWIKRDEAQQIQKESDYLIFLDWSIKETPGVLPAKIYEYMASNTPILFLGFKDSEAAQILTTTQTAEIISNTENEIISFLDSILTSGAKAFNPQADEINYYLRSNQSKRLETFLKRNQLL